MVKMIEDILFENDKFNIVKKIIVSSDKSVTKRDYVDVFVNEI
jgi:hypothetical protein